MYTHTHAHFEILETKQKQLIERHSTTKWTFHALCDTIMKLSTQIVVLVITSFWYRAIADLTSGDLYSHF